MDYTKCPEGVEQFEKYGLKYPRQLSDEMYENYLEETKKSPKDKTLFEIRKMNRVVLPDKTQWIVHDQADIRYDKIGNLSTWSRGNIGRYPIVVPYYELKTDPESLEKIKVCTGLN